MARISDVEIERLKKDVSVERLAEAMGVELKRHGADLHGCCPFHEDNTPSLVISPGKNLWHCLGACQVGGSVIDWVMKAEGVSFRHAVELLREDIVPEGAATKASTVRKLSVPVDASGEDQAVLQQVVAYYQERLKQTPAALEYLKSRGLDSAEMVNHFRLGFSDRTLGLRLPAKNRLAGAELRGRLQTLGLIRESGHEHFNGSLVIPILDEAGNVTSMYGRKVTPNLRPGTPLHLYLPRPHRGVFNVAGLRGARQVILCEAILDALTFWCAGYRNVTCAYGVSGFTDAHLLALKKSGAEEILIAYDRDEAGESAAEELSKQLLEEGFGCFRVQFPKGMDANEYASKLQPATRALELVIRKALWMGKGKPRALVNSSVVALPAFPLAAVLPAAEPSVDEKSVREDPPAPTPEPEAESASAKPPAAKGEEDELVVVLGERRYRIRGLGKNSSHETLKVNVLVSKTTGDGFHVDTLDMYAAKARAAYMKQASLELRVSEDVVKTDLGKLLLKLEEAQETRLQRLLEPKTKTVTLSQKERDEALGLLKSPNLLERILKDFDKCGVVGEETNKLVGYLAAVSRKLDAPLAIVIQSSSAAGKTSLMDAVLAFVPEEDRVQYSAMTGQALFYMGDTDLKHKVLAIAEEEGASRASYALKLLQSEGELTIASTGKDANSGRLVTHEYHVEGPAQLFLTTTAIEVDEELMNRCLVLSVDEDREQTRAIHQLQRKRQTLEGHLARRERDGILELHRNAQRLLQPLLVVNPYAEQLTFLDDRTRMRRDHMKYLTLIQAIALLHQHQRPVKTAVDAHGEVLEYVEVTSADIAVANQLAHQLLGRSLDELPPQTRRLLHLLEQMVTAICEKTGLEQKDCRFSRRDVRMHVGWSDTQLKLHLSRLAELEHVLVHRGLRGNSFSYELVYDGKGKDGAPFLSGLLDVDEQSHAYDVNRSGVETNRSAPGRPLVGVRSAPGPTSEAHEELNEDADLSPENVVANANHANARLGAVSPALSYVHVASAVRG